MHHSSQYIQPIRMRQLVILATLALLSGCAVFTPYAPEPTDKMATLNFISPSLEDLVYADEDLDLIIFYDNSNCKIKPQGRLAMDLNIKEMSTLIPAERYIYFRLSYFRNCFGCGTSSSVDEFVFAPKAGAEYTVEYLDMGRNYKIQIEEEIAGGNITAITPYVWKACKAGLLPEIDTPENQSLSLPEQI